MIESVRIEDDGPDGTYLVVEVEGDWDYRFGNNCIIVQVNDAVLAQLDRALQPWRDHMAEGERVRAELQRHVGAGYCPGWVSGEGPCQLPYGHGGLHSRRKIFAEGEEV